MRAYALVEESTGRVIELGRDQREAGPGQVSFEIPGGEFPPDDFLRLRWDGETGFRQATAQELYDALPDDGKSKADLIAAYQQIGTDLAAIRTQAATLKAGKQALIDVAQDIIDNATAGNAVAKLKALATAFKQLVNGVDSIVDGVDLLAEDGEKARKGLRMVAGA